MEVPSRRGQRPKDIALIPRDARPQFDEPDRLRNQPRRVVAERLFDHRLIPQPHGRRDHLLLRHPRPDARRNRYNRPIRNVPFQLLQRHPEAIRRRHQRHVGTRCKKDAADVVRVGWGHVSLLRVDSPYDIDVFTSRQREIMTLRASATPEGEIFGSHLRELRTASGLTQAQLAELARTSKPFISNLERGLTTPTLGMLLRLAEALECRPSELIKIFDRSPRVSPRSRKG